MTSDDEKRRKLAKKALNLKWKEGISLSSAWGKVTGKKRKSSSTSGKSKSSSKSKVGRPKSSSTSGKSKSSSKSKVGRPKSSKPKSESRPKTRAVVNGRERTIYTGRGGGKYYKSKGEKHYISSM